MRNLKALGLAAVAVLAMAALAAPAAQAEEDGDFWAEAGAVTIDAAGGTQTFTLPSLPSNPLTCATVTGEAEYNGESAELTGENISYNTCHVVVFGITFPVTVDMNGCHYTFTAGTFSGSTSEGQVHIENCEQNESVTITMFETNGSTLRCEFHVPEQTVPVSFHNENNLSEVMVVRGVASNAAVSTTITDNNKFGCNNEETVNSSYSGSFIAEATDIDENAVDGTVTGT